MLRIPLPLRLSPLLLLLGAGCSHRLGDPLAPLARTFDKYPRYSIVLQDMDRRGVFFKSYHHLYKVIYGVQQEGEEALTFRSETTPWTEVGDDFYRRHEPLLGMVILSKGDDGEVSRESFPPGYQYVGDSRYGRWRSDASGGSFWEFYGKYALFSQLLGMGTRPLYRWDYDRYRDYRRRGDPYFGPSGNYYGTRGTYTRKSNPTFFERQQARERSRSSRFSDKVRSRTGAGGARGFSRSGK